MSTETARLIRDGERGYRGGGRGRIYTYRYTDCHHQNDSCIKMGSDESHFNIPLIVRDKATRQSQSTDQNFFSRERRAEAESIRGPSAYQPSALPLGQTGSHPLIVWQADTLYLPGVRSGCTCTDVFRQSVPQVPGTLSLTGYKGKWPDEANCISLACASVATECNQKVFGSSQCSHHHSVYVQNVDYAIMPKNDPALAPTPSQPHHLHLPPPPPTPYIRGH